MTGHEFIFLASQLIVLRTFGSAEARHRSAVSRAYYGAFHLATEFLQELNFVVRTNHTGHEEAYRTLDQTGNADAQDAASTLDELRTLRIAADYRLSDRKFADEQIAKQLVGIASDFVPNLQKCREEPSRSEIQAYLNSIRED